MSFIENCFSKNCTKSARSHEVAAMIDRNISGLFSRNSKTKRFCRTNFERKWVFNEHPHEFLRCKNAAVFPSQSYFFHFKQFGQAASSHKTDTKTSLHVIYLTTHTIYPVAEAAKLCFVTRANLGTCQNAAVEKPSHRIVGTRSKIRV